MFVSDCGKCSVLKAEPVKKYEVGTMNSMGMVIPPIIFKFPSFDISSFKFHLEFFKISQAVLGYVAVTNNTQISVA